LKNLSTLNLAKNCLSNSEDLEGLLECPSITNLDLSSNNIDDISVVENVLKKMPNLSALYLKGNPCVRKIKHYRKNLLSTMPQLAYLDERPVFELERVAVNAWKEGGIEAERAARKQFQADKVNKDRESMNSFRRWKEERRAARKAMIQKCKDEGKPVPKPKSYVSYRELSNEELDRVDSDRRALAKAEKIVGANSNDIKTLGREYWKERGVPVYDENGEVVTEGSPSKTKQESVEEIRPTTEQSDEASTIPPAPSSNSTPPLPPSQSEAQRKEDLEVEKAQQEEERRKNLEEDERRNRVAESYRMYQQQRQVNSASNKREPSKLSYTEKIMMEQNALKDNPGTGRNAGVVMTEEEENLSVTEKDKLQQMVAEAEEEEDNYRDARARMKMQSQQRSSRSSDGWTKVLDQKLEKCVLKHIFDFDKVAEEMKKTSEVCRLRYAMLDKFRSNENKAPNPLTQLVENEAKRNKARLAKDKNAPTETKSSQRDVKVKPSRTTSSDPYASFAASNVSASSITVDFSKLPSMQSSDVESSDDEDDVQPGIFKSALRSSDIHKEMFGSILPDENSGSINGVLDSAGDTKSTDVDGLD